MSNPGDAEAAAAIEGMRDTYAPLPCCGSWVTFRRDWWPSGRTACGQVRLSSRGGVTVEVDGTPTYVRREELLAVAPGGPAR